MRINGTLKKIGDIQTYESGFQKREIVILTHEQYPNPIQFEILSTNVSITDNFNINDPVTVHFNIAGREWNSPSGEIKYFNSFKAWKITPENS